MRTKIDLRVPRYSKLILPTFNALRELGGSGSNEEILNHVIADLAITDEVADISHKGSTNMSELQYQLAWARTYMKSYGVIENSSRSVWAIRPDFMGENTLDEKAIVASVVKKGAERRKNHTGSTAGQSELDEPEDDNPENDEIEYPDEAKPWRVRLAEILQSIDPYGFERPSQRVLRECGFSHVEVTKKSGDGGIDGNSGVRLQIQLNERKVSICNRWMAPSCIKCQVTNIRIATNAGASY